MTATAWQAGSGTGIALWATLGRRRECDRDGDDAPAPPLPFDLEFDRPVGPAGPPLNQRAAQCEPDLGRGAGAVPGLVGGLLAGERHDQRLPRRGLDQPPRVLGRIEPVGGGTANHRVGQVIEGVPVLDVDTDAEGLKHPAPPVQ